MSGSLDDFGKWLMTCIPGPVGRLIKGRHATPCVCPDTEGDPGEESSCLPCPEDHCLTCHRAHVTEEVPVTCPSCLGRARENLSMILMLAGRLDAESRLGRHAMAVHADEIPGGDALVLGAPAATESGAVAQLGHRMSWNLDTSHVHDESEADPRPPLAVLLRWETRARIRLGQMTDLAPTLDRVAAYLDTSLHVLARDPSFAPMARDLAGTVRRLEDVLHEGVRAELTRVPCWECGTRLVKVYCAKAADDHWKCPRCRERYDRGRYDLAKSDHLASVGAERFVFVSDAVSAIGRPGQTVRTWMRRGQVRISRHPESHRLLVWWPDVRAMARDGVSGTPDAPDEAPDGVVGVPDAATEATA